MFYAHFVLSKKGPLARIWLAAHWDKKLTKAHVFETNIDSSVDAILKPKVKLALRTSGHLLLGVVRIYSRKAKYLLADCNEAFVKIKMAFRPGVVDLPEENREAAVAAITLQENFHDFDTTLADLDDIDVQAQFSVNQSRPEEITMREDYAHITLVGDDGFGDVGFDEKEILRDASNFEDSLYKSDLSVPQPVEEKDKTLSDSTTEKPMEVDLEAPVMDDGFGGTVGDGFMGDHGLMGGGLFEETPMVDVSLPSEVVAAEPAEAEKLTEEKEVENSQSEAEPAQPQPAAAGASGEQTTLVHNEDEAFALEPLDVTAVPGAEKRGKRKRKLVVDEQKGIPSESMKLQLSDTSDIISTLDLAPPTKKLMHWKETGGVEKLFSLPGRAIISKYVSKLFHRSLKTKPILNEDEWEEDKLDLDAPEIPREEKTQNDTSYRPQEISTIVEEPSTIAEISTRSAIEDKSFPEPAPEEITKEADTTLVQDPVFGQDPNLGQGANLANEDVFGVSTGVDLPQDPSLIQHDFDDGPPSIAPFSVPPPSVGPESVGPPSVGPPSVGPPSVAPQSVPPMVFEDLETNENEAMPENAEQEEKRWTKRTQQMQQSLGIAFRYNDELSFKDMCRRHNRKQAASRFYTLLVLKKHQAIDVEQPVAYSDILITKGPNFGIAC